MDPRTQINNDGLTGNCARQNRHFQTRGSNNSRYALHSRKATEQKAALQENVSPKNARRKARRAASGKQSATKGQSTIGQVKLNRLHSGGHSISRRQWKVIMVEPMNGPTCGPTGGTLDEPRKEKTVKWKGKSKLAGRRETVPT